MERGMVSIDAETAPIIATDRGSVEPAPSHIRMSSYVPSYLDLGHVFADPDALNLRH